jgi:hypothetical protein
LVTLARDIRDIRRGLDYLKGENAIMISSLIVKSEESLNLKPVDLG